MRVCVYSNQHVNCSIGLSYKWGLSKGLGGYKGLWGTGPVGLEEHKKPVGHGAKPCVKGRSARGNGIRGCE